MSLGAVAVLAGAAFLGEAKPVGVKEYEYCRKDYPADMRQCGFETMEQCIAMISGRGGSCIRNPVLNETSASLRFRSEAPTAPVAGKTRSATIGCPATDVGATTPRSLSTPAPQCTEKASAESQ